MPWKETCVMDERMQFVGMCLSQDWDMTDLCQHFGISRKTGYKWLDRYQQAGSSGLEDRSRAPLHHPQAVATSIEEAVVSARRGHCHWGPKKLRSWLERQDSSVQWPAASTIGEILSRHGLTVSRKRRRSVRRYDKPFLGCYQPNSIWSADLKGWFRTGDGERCDPLTITDNFSRYLIRCQVVHDINYDCIQPVFEAAFREYGLPVAIRTDNGVPFATTTVAGLSRLSIWWLKLGIIPERIEPGKPAQNGRHERMHRTLKRETASPPKRNWRQQQEAFDRFLEEYNHERPHEGISMKSPIDLYETSPRQYPLLVPEVAYPDDMVIRIVHSQGDLRWKCRQIYLSQTLAGEHVGCRQIDEHLWDIYFSTIKLAQLDTREYRLRHLPQPSKSEKKNSEKKE